MAKRHLTAAFVKNAKPAPGSAQTDYFDTAVPGFGLRAGKARKTWFCMARVLKAGDWKLTRVTLGTTAELSLASARQAARDAIEQAQQGKDPSTARLQRRDALEARSKDTFVTVRDLFLERYIGRQQRRPAPRTLVEMRRALSSDVLASWEDRPLADIAERDILEALDELTARGADTMANRTLAYLRLLFKWSRSRRIIATDPSTDVAKPGAELSRDRVLSLDELRAIWNATDPTDLFGAIVRALLLTGQRKTEISDMRWAEIDSETWTLPPERTKNRRRHAVPLSAPMLDILEARRAEQTAMGIKTPFVFATSGKALPDGTRSAPRPFAQWARAKSRLDAKAGLAEPWRQHDLRRSMVTHCADKLRIAPHVIEATVNHVSGSKGGVAGVYNRAEHLDERRAALNAWADFLLRIVGEVQADNVVELAG
jgi:integrase